MSQADNPSIEARESFVRENANKIILDWKNHVPVYLATSSDVRRKGVVGEGFKEENIHTVEMPGSLETLVLEDYLENFDPSWLDPNGSIGIEAVAKAKVEFSSAQNVPENALWFAWDTMPVHYERNSSGPADSELPGTWKSIMEQKPKTLDEAKIMIRNNFLTIIKNYSSFKDYLSTQKKDWSQMDDAEKERYQKIDFASAVHIKTAFAVRFPNEKDVHVTADRVIIRPEAIYEIAKDSDGASSIQKIDLIIDRIFETMIESGVDPLKIAGGIDYSLEKVRDILKAKEMPNVVVSLFGSKEVDRSIYTGFPVNLFENVISKHAETLARKELK